LNILKKIHLIIFGIFLFFPAGCEKLTYSPDKENIFDISKPHADLEINFGSGDDTLNVYGIIDLKYSINTKDKQFAQILVYIDSLLVGSTDNKSTCRIDTRNITPGLHSLKIELWVYSGSGSLADKTKSEFLISSKQRNIFIDKPLEIDSIYTHNGSLKMIWSEYQNADFKSYSVYKADLNYGDFVLQETITDRSQNFWFDKKFLSGTYRYKVEVSTSTYSIPGVEKTFSDIVTAYIYPPEKLNDTTVVIRWKPYKYYSNFTKYLLHSEIGPQREQIAAFLNYHDTSFTHSPGFGNNVSYYLTIEASSVRSNYASSMMGNKFTAFKDLKYFPSINSIYVNDLNLNSQLFDASSLTIKTKKNGTVYFSKSGNHAFTNSQYPSHGLMRVDPLTLTAAGNTFTMESILGYQSTFSGMAVLENGNCLFSGRSFNAPDQYGPFTFVYINTDPPGLIMKDSSHPFAGFGTISISESSDEGQYILYDNYLINAVNDKFTISGQVSENICFSQSGKEYVSTSYNSISIYSCRNNTLLKRYYTGTNLLSPVIDPATGYLGGQTNYNTYRIYDLKDGRLIKQIKLLFADRFYMANSILFSSYGYYLKLNFSQ